MKKLFSILAVAVLVNISFSSCHHTLTDADKAKLHESCNGMMTILYNAADSKSICDCYVDKVAAANTTDSKAMSAMMDSCTKGYKTSLEMSTDSMMHSMSIDTTGGMSMDSSK